MGCRPAGGLGCRPAFGRRPRRQGHLGHLWPAQPHPPRRIGSTRALEPDTRYRVEGTLNHIGHEFPAGNRLRVSISYCPLAWPAPQPARVTIHTGGSELVLPECLRRDAEDRLIAFAEPEGAPSTPTRRVEAGQHK